MPITNIDAKFIEDLIFSKFQKNIRFTQDSPIYPDVWMEYFRNASYIDTYRCDLILSPHRKSSASELLKILSRVRRIENFTEIENWALASTGESIAAKFTFKELITIVLPLTEWGQNILLANNGETRDLPSSSLMWIQELIGAIYFLRNKEINNTEYENVDALRNSLRNYCLEMGYLNIKRKELPEAVLLYSISRNRPAYIAIDKSVPATKADAGRRVFDIDGSGIVWAVLDTGIDARHEAFSKSVVVLPSETNFGKERLIETRVIATYDFTKFRDVLVMAALKQKNLNALGKNTSRKLVSITSDSSNQKLSPVEKNNFLNEIGKDLHTGRFLDWSIISPLLRIPHKRKEYMPPIHSHGTHVAGIIGACKERSEYEKPLIGMCPKIGLYDIRVMNDEGEGDEFNILAALQFIRWINSQSDGIIIHGINLSLSMIHEVASFGCGQTPVCISCERLVSEGIVVVAAAGNQGQAMFQSPQGLIDQGFRMVNITDPGNAESVITVGSTHSNRPHSYGVSYFSSKGPTGDGRVKPDLVAPGEKIESTSINNGTERRDGTSMAAPHVSGAAALLMSKHRELIGNPKKIKSILCSTATDLGREKYFQGCGMIDVLRAIQSV